MHRCTTLMCHCEEANGRRGALSAKREEVPLGCNLGKAAAISPMVFLLFGMCREIATSASGLLAMTNLGALRQKQCSACCKPPWRSPSAPKNTEAAPLLRRLPTISGEIDKGQSSAWKFCPCMLRSHNVPDAHFRSAVSRMAGINKVHNTL